MTVAAKDTVMAAAGAFYKAHVWQRHVERQMRELKAQEIEGAGQNRDAWDRLRATLRVGDLLVVPIEGEDVGVLVRRTVHSTYAEIVEITPPAHVAEDLPF